MVLLWVSVRARAVSNYKLAEIFEKYEWSFSPPTIARQVHFRNENH